MRIPAGYMKWVLLAGALATAGCGSLVELPGSNAEAPQIFSVSPLDGDGADGTTEWAIFIEEPTVPGELRSNRIAVRQRDLEISYLSGVRWSEHTANLIRRHLLVSLGNSTRFQAISDRDIELPADYRLKLDVRDFHVTESAGGEQVRMTVAMRLVRNGPVRLVDETILTSTQRSGSAAASSVAGAFDRALDDVAGQLHSWLSDTLARDGDSTA